MKCKTGWIRFLIGMISDNIENYSAKLYVCPDSKQASIWNSRGSVVRRREVRVVWIYHWWKWSAGIPDGASRRL